MTLAKDQAGPITKPDYEALKATVKRHGITLVISALYDIAFDRAHGGSPCLPRSPRRDFSPKHKISANHARSSRPSTPSSFRTVRKNLRKPEWPTKTVVFERSSLLCRSDSPGRPSSPWCCSISSSC